MATRFAVCACLVLLVAACGKDDDSPGIGGATTQPTGGSGGVGGQGSEGGAGGEVPNTAPVLIGAHQINTAGGVSWSAMALAYLF